MTSVIDTLEYLISVTQSKEKLKLVCKQIDFVKSMSRVGKSNWRSEVYRTATLVKRKSESRRRAREQLMD